MRDRRYVQDLTTDELEQELIIRRHEERLERLRRVGALRAVDAVLLPDPGTPYEPPLPATGERAAGHKSGFALWRERVLITIEFAALIGLVIVIASFALNVRRINQDWKEQYVSAPGPTPTATAVIRPSILPGGHAPCDAQGGHPVPRSKVGD
jgi:hypothetical protein